MKRFIGVITISENKNKKCIRSCVWVFVYMSLCVFVYSAYNGSLWDSQ